MAGDNLRWGYRRIVGELKKLGIRIGTTTIRDILKEEGHFPDPMKAVKNPPIPWTTYIRANMDSIVACDFFTKRIFTLRGAREAYVLAFIHLGSRRVYCSPSTYHPDSERIMQQARNASMWMEDQNIEARFLIRDRDRKYPDAFVETFIASTKREVLNHFVCFSRDQLDHILRIWLRHYHEDRPHRGVGRDNTILNLDFKPLTEGRIRCRSELGGILKSYYREAA